MDNAATRAGRSLRRAATTVVLAATLAAGFVATAATPAGAADCVTSLAAMGPEAEARFVARLDELRRSRGLPALVVNARLADQSRSWSGVMGSQDWLHHARDTGGDDGVEPHQDYVNLLPQSVPDWSRAAENVGVNGLTRWCSQDEQRAVVLATSDSIHNAFVNSAGHQANMVGDFNQVGIGVSFASNKLWVTVRFAKGSVPASSAQAGSDLSQANEYVDAVHRLFLGRAASAGELDRWGPVVARGDRGSLTGALAVSNEWAGSRVTDLYRTILHREPDASGQHGWVSAIARGMRIEDVAAGFYGSQERFAHAGGSVEEYVRGLYRDVLGRDPDAAGLSDWTGRVHRGAMTRSQVAAGFYGSVESRTSRVDGLYHAVLGRAPDAGGRSHWARRLSSMGDVVLAATLASSTEYWNKATA